MRFTNEYELRTGFSFQKPTQNEDMFYVKAALLASGLPRVLLSYITARPRKFPGKCAPPQCLQFLHLTGILLHLESFFFFFFDVWEAVTTKKPFLQWGNSMVPRKTKGVDWEMGIWVHFPPTSTISLLPVPFPSYQYCVFFLASVASSVKWNSVDMKVKTSAIVTINV